MYIYGAGTVTIIDIGACVFIAYNKTFSDSTNKKQPKEPIEQMAQPIKPPKLTQLASR